MVVAVLTRVVAVLTRVVAVLECRRFGMSPFLLSPFRLVAVMTGTHLSDGAGDVVDTAVIDPPVVDIVAGEVNSDSDTDSSDDIGNVGYLDNDSIT